MRPLGLFSNAVLTSLLCLLSIFALWGCTNTTLPLSSTSSQNTQPSNTQQSSGPTTARPSPSSSPNTSPSASSTPQSPSATPTPGSTPPTTGNPQPGPQDHIVFQDDFESGDLSKWDITHPESAIESDLTYVSSGKHSLRATFTPTDGSGSLEKWYMPGYGEVYFSADVMYSAGFQNMRPDGWGMHLMMLRGNRIDNMYSAAGKAGVKPNGTDFFVTNVDPEDQFQDPTLRPFMFYTYYPDMTCGSSSCYGNNIFQPDPKIPLTSGVWQHIAVHIKLNTPGLHDGSQTLWINGKAAIDMQNMRWRDTLDLKQNQLTLANYMDAASPITEYIWWDNILVWAPGNGTP